MYLAFFILHLLHIIHNIRKVASRLNTADRLADLLLLRRRRKVEGFATFCVTVKLPQCDTCSLFFSCSQRLTRTLSQKLLVTGSTDGGKHGKFGHKHVKC